MKHALIYAAVASLAIVAAALAQDARPNCQRPDGKDDVQDFIFLTESRPLLVRTHVRVDGKPYKAVWDEYVARVFKFLDTDGDGVLSQKEVDRMPPLQFLTGGFGPRGPQVGKGSGLTTGKDGTVSRDELAAYLRKNGAAPFQFQMGKGGGNYGAKIINLGAQTPVSATALNDAIFALLDTNHDGKLSREELAAAPERFAARDTNDDEVITTDELVPSVGGSSLAFKVPLAAPKAVDGPVILINSGESGTALARRLIDRYGGKGKTKLTAAQIGLDKATFDRLDADKNGELDAEELAQFARRTPDVELTIRVGTRGDGERPVEGIARGEAVRDVKVSDSSDCATLDLGVTHLDIRAGAESSGFKGNFNFRLRDQFVNQFKAADTDNNGYLDEKEAMASPLFRNLFKALDTDGDGMLYEKEMVAYLDKVEELQKAVQAGCVTLALSDEGNGLFDLLDRNHDGRLSVRELRDAVDLLKTLDRDGDGLISRSEIPHKFEMRVRPGPAGNGDDFGRVVVVASSKFTSSSAEPTGPGPLWFRKMDTNHDGDLSRREFLGTDEEFRKIDTDGDGLISSAEAEAFDKRMRKSKK
ncbi:MAG: hypothetical protein ACJ8F7_01210 [Gemmataceae bacterium]